MSKLKIIQKKTPGKTDSFFYDGAIAEMEGKDGVVYKLIAAGDIRVNIQGCSYRDASQAELNHKLTDARLKQLEKTGELSWDNNNWFEVVWLDKKSSSWECDIGVVEYDYDSGIEMLKNYANGEHVEG